MNLLNLSRTLAAQLFATALLLASAGSALAGVHYVDLNSTNATPPYSNWAAAATNIQDAVDAAVAGDEIVVTNGTYATGGRSLDGSTTNRVAVDKAIALRSANGPQFTIIDGIYADYTRCVYLTNTASLSGFTLTQGNAYSGGGAYGGTLYNCTMTRNEAVSDPESGYINGFGGGAAGCTLYNCTLTSNRAGYGGGAYNCTLNSCTLQYNEAFGDFSGPYDESRGGGAASCILNNCVLSYNSASYGYGSGHAFGGGAYDCAMNNCTLTYNSVSSTYQGLPSGLGGGVYGSTAISSTLNNCIVYFNIFQNSYADNYYASRLNYCCTTPQPGGTSNITNAPLFGAGLRLQPNSPCINAGNNSYVTNATDLDGNPRISGGIVDIGAYEYQWPQLSITPSGPNVILTWPTNNAGYDYTGFTLQSTTNLVSPLVWSTNSPAPVVIAGQNTVTNPITGAQQFYRLVQ
jgi:hypothetical protein